MAEETQETPTLTNLRPDATIGIQPYILRQEEVEEILKKEGTNAPKELAIDLIRVFSASDFKEEIEQDPNFLSYDLLRSGKAKILDFIPAYAGKAPVDRQLSDQDINILFSNAKEATFARPFFTELAKTAPATFAGIKTAGTVGSQLIPRAAATGPLSPVAVPAAITATGLLSLGSAGLTYFAGQKIEDAVLGPETPITPTSKAAYEAYKTLGAFTSSIYAPWLFKEGVDLGYNALVSNLVDDASPPFQAKLLKVFENMIGGTAKLAKTAPKTTAGAEIISAGGATAGAFISEQAFPEQITPRVMLEFLGANTLYSTFLRSVPGALDALKQTDVVGGIVDKKQEKLFSKIREAYDLYGSKEGYDQLIDNLTNPTFIKELEENFPGIKFTAAQQSGDPFIMALEGVKAKGNQKLDATRKQNSAKAEAFLVGVIKALMEKGDDQSLKQAANLRKSVFSNTLKLAYEEKLENFLKAAENLQKQPGQTAKRSQAQLSTQMFNLLEDTLESVRKKEQDLWDKVGSIDLIQPVGPNAKAADLPNFIKMYNKILPEDPAVRKDFEDKTKVLSNFIAEARKDLGLTPTINLTTEEAKTIKNYEKITEKAQIRLSGRAEERVLNSILRQSKDMDDAAKVKFFRGQANTLSAQESLSSNERLLIRALESYGDLSAVKVTASKRARIRKQTPLTDTQPITAKRLVEIRSRALSLARAFAKDAENREFAMKTGKFAEAVLEDLDKDGFGQNYNIAKDFSRAKNDVYTRAVAGKIRDKKASGEASLPPEVTFELLVKNNPSVTLNRFRQLQDLSEFLNRENITLSKELTGNPEFINVEKSEPVFTTMSNLVEGYLRTLKKTAAKEVFDPKTNTTRTVIDPAKLQEFKKDNAELLELLPSLKLDLENTERAAKTLAVFEKTQKRGLDISKGQKELSNLLNGSSPTVAIAEAFNDPKNPALKLNNIFSLQRVTVKDKKVLASKLPQFKEFTPAAKRAKKINDAGLDLKTINDAFKRSILQYAFTEAGGEGDFNPQTFAKIMYGALPKDPNKSLMDVVGQYKIFSDAELSKIRSMTTQLLKVQAADASGKINDPDFAKEAGPILDFYYGIGGSALGTRAYGLLTGGQAGPGSIMAAGVGARTVREYLQELPLTKRLEAIELSFLDPQLTAQLLKKPKTERDRKRVSDTILNILTKTFGNVGRQGIPIAVPKVGEAITPEGDAAKERFQLKERQLQEMQQRGAPMIQPQIAPVNQTSPSLPNIGTQAQIAPPVQNQRVDRRRFAALFPEDADLVQGIGSLRG